MLPEEFSFSATPSHSIRSSLMSFSHHEAGERDGHSDSRYLGPRGVIARDRRWYTKARDVVFDPIRGCPPTMGGQWGELVKEYRAALFAYASTVYSAKLLRPMFAMCELLRLVGEIEHLMTFIPLAAPQKEALMGFHAYLRYHDTWWTGEQGRMRKAVALGREILADKEAPFGTRLLALAHMSNICDYVEDDERRYYRHEVLVALAGLTVNEEFLGLDQGWKTVCHLGMLIKAWHFVDLALSYDKSRDLRIKAYVQPGFVWYKMKTSVFE